jgi:hypothetical protein
MNTYFQPFLTSLHCKSFPLNTTKNFIAKLPHGNYQISIEFLGICSKYDLKNVDNDGWQKASSHRSKKQRYQDSIEFHLFGTGPMDSLKTFQFVITGLSNLKKFTKSKPQSHGYDHNTRTIHTYCNGHTKVKASFLYITKFDKWLTDHISKNKS